MSAAASRDLSPPCTFHALDPAQVEPLKDEQTLIRRMALLERRVAALEQQKSSNPPLPVVKWQNESSPLPAESAEALWLQLDRVAVSAAGVPNPFENMGHVREMPRELAFIRRFMKKLFNKKPSQKPVHVCEIGFNCGHSAVLFLTALSHQRVRYTTFDLGTLPWSNQAAALMRQQFQERFLYIQGTTGEGRALQDFAAAIKAGHAQPCDLLSVDGDHQYAPSLADYMNGRAITPGGYIFADDVHGMNTAQHGGEALRAWKEAMYRGYIVQLDCEEEAKPVRSYYRGWCIGKYKRISPTPRPPPAPSLHKRDFGPHLTRDCLASNSGSWVESLPPQYNLRHTVLAGDFMSKSWAYSRWYWGPEASKSCANYDRRWGWEASCGSYHGQQAQLEALRQLCTALDGKEVLFVGDSISGQHWTSFAMMLGIAPSSYVDESPACGVSAEEAHGHETAGSVQT